MQEIPKTWVRSLGWEDSLEEGMATHSSILARRIPWTEEPGGLQSMGSQRVGYEWSYLALAAAAAKLLQLCLTLYDSIDGSPPGSPIPGILQARTLEWVAISFSSAWKWKVKVKLLSHVRLLVTTWNMDCSLPGFSIHGIFQARVLEWVAIVFSNLADACSPKHNFIPFQQYNEIEITMPI